MYKTSIAYTDCLKGLPRRAPSVHPVAAYFAERGARVRTNIFHDKDLVLGDDLLVNLRNILASGREQGFERLDLRIPQQLVREHGSLAAQLMVLERVVIDVQEDTEELVFRAFYPEVIWREASYWRARRRTSLHPKHMTESELFAVLEAVSFPERTAKQEQLLARAVEDD